MNQLTVGSLFAGIGGFDKGLEAAGIQCKWQVEIDPTARQVLARHWPDVARFEDVRTVGAHNLAPVDVITFGSPCQDLSVAGNRAGMNGARSGLFFEACRIIRELRPEFAIWENVPGAFSSSSGRDFGRALDGLAESGALDICWRVLDAQWFGLAQRRKRVFVVADFRAHRAAQVLFEPESSSGDSPTRGEAGEDIAATLRSRSHRPGVNPPGRGGEDDDNLIIGTLDCQPNTGQSDGHIVLAHALTSHPGRQDATTDTYCFDWQQSGDGQSGRSPALVTARTPAVITHTLRSEGADASEDGTGRGVPLVVDEGQITSAGNYSNQKAGDPCHPLSATMHPPLMVQPTVRRLTPMECERLQGFPDGWTDGHSDSARYRMIGNAVAVPVIEWIGRRIVTASHKTN